MLTTTVPTSILDMDAVEIAKQIKQGNLSSTVAVQTYIEQINKYNPKIRAMVEDRFTKALAEAAKLDMADEPIGTLHGVPISMKEAFDVTGMKTTGGLVQRKDLIAQTDAAIVQKLKAAGAIILGKTNTPALCFCQETDNKLYGRTNNPWDILRTAGGSSGGEGALLAFGGAAAGIGSDIGGSIRFPSHLNGVVGFKPGMFQVNAEGHFPSNHIPLQNRMLGIGPMGKSVRDMELLYQLISTYQPKEIDLDQYAIHMLPHADIKILTTQSKLVLSKIEQSLHASVSVSYAKPPFFDESAQLWQEIMSIDGAKSLRMLAYSDRISSPVHAFIKEKVFGNSIHHPYLSWALIGAAMFTPSAPRIQEIHDIIAKGDNQINHMLNRSLFILPVYRQGAVEHGKLYKDIFSIRKTFKKHMPFVAYANVWGLPSLTIPIGQDENHMPIAIQIISRIGNESAIFQLGHLLEKQFRGYQRYN
ncbi:amidase [Ornithinibacillus gellani]|uniref:amidase n=1 Tax=Ornithinibacillus gellani TaxID=2293253 RepID=UPI001CC1CD0F|nr:amidase [Ornithinibacillus gellani]